MNKIFLKLGFNTAIQSISRIVSSLLGLVSIAILTRYLGVVGYGNYSLVFAYLSFFGAFSDLGFNAAIINELNKKNNLKLLIGTYFWIKLVMSIISFLLPICLLVFFPYSGYQKTAILIGAFAFGIGNLAGYGNTFLQAKLRLDLVSYIDVLNKIITVLLTVLFIAFRANLFIILSSVLFGNIISVIITFIAVKEYVKFPFYFSRKTMLYLTKISFPIGITAILSLLYFRIDSVMLSIMKGPREVGIYSLSYKIFENFLIFWAFYVATFYPLLSKYYNSGDYKNYKKILKNSILLAIGFGIIIFIVGFFASPIFIKVLGGRDFVQSILPFKILLLTGTFFFLNNILYYYFFIKKRTDILIKSLIISLIANIVLNYALIPKYSYLGSSVATVITEIFLFLIYLLASGSLHKTLRYK